MIRTVRAAILLTTLAIISTISTAALSHSKSSENPQKWVDFGTVKGVQLKLDVYSIYSVRQPINDRIDLIGRDKTFINSVPMHRVVSFRYTAAGKRRTAYTTSCQGGKLKANPSWRAAAVPTSNPRSQYFSVPANSLAKGNMLARVCKIAATK